MVNIMKIKACNVTIIGTDDEVVANLEDGSRADAVNDRTWKILKAASVADDERACIVRRGHPDDRTGTANLRARLPSHERSTKSLDTLGVEAARVGNP